MARKSREDLAIAANVAKIAQLHDEIKTLIAVNDALATLRDAHKRPKPVRRPALKETA